MIKKDWSEIELKDLTYDLGKELILKAHHALKSVIEGNLTYKGMPVEAYMPAWGYEDQGICYVCLAGAFHLQETGNLIKEVTSVERLLNEFRYYCLGSNVPYSTSKLIKLGIKINPSQEHIANNPKGIVNYLGKIIQENGWEVIDGMG